MSDLENLGDVITETKCSIELTTNLEIDYLTFLPEPTTEAFNSHIPKTPIVSLAYLLLKYREKIHR